MPIEKTQTVEKAVTIETTEHRPLRLAGLKVIGRQSELSHRVPLAWVDLNRKAEELAEPPQRYYGVFRPYDFPADGGDGMYIYWVTLETREYEPIPDGLEVVEIPRQSYAVITCRGQSEAIEGAYLELFTWLEASEERTAPGALGFELYEPSRQSIVPPYPEFDYDIYWPIG